MKQARAEAEIKSVFFFKWRVTLLLQVILHNNQSWSLPQKFDAERRANFCSQKFFSLEKNLPNPEIRDNPHSHQYWWSSTPSPPKALRLAVQLPLQQKNHQVPNPHTVAASLCTVVHPPPMALQAIYYHPSRQSTITFDYLCSGPVQNPLKQKKKFYQFPSGLILNHLLSDLVSGV